ncbi:DapH/DapD/GlmU-related protein [Vibrio alginolyticus]
MKIAKYIINIIARFLCYTFSDLKVREYKDIFGFQSSVWILKSFWFQKILGFNRGAPFPCHYSVRISNFNNLDVDVTSYINFQSPGIYFQNIDAQIIIGKNCLIGPNVGLITTNHDLNNISRHSKGKDIIIGDNCWVGMNTVILPGVELASDTIVGAGSVVTKSFKSGKVIIGGNPAKVIREI